jgi:DNA-binding MarR family transcriptional regulator
MAVGDDNPLNGEPRCTGAVIRRASRRVTQVYDDVLKPLGLKLTKYSLLANIHEMDGPSVTDLADRMDMDRTTLTRNLAPLRTAGWVQMGPGTDRRRRSIRLTTDGEAMLAAARPVWREAELRIRDVVGVSRTAEVRRLLGETIRAIGEG